MDKMLFVVAGRPSPSVYWMVEGRKVAGKMSVGRQGVVINRLQYSM